MKGESPPSIYRKLIYIYGPNVMTIEMMQHWLQQFKEGRTKVHDGEQPDRPSEAITDNVVIVIHAVIEVDQCFTFPTILHD